MSGPSSGLPVVLSRAAALGGLLVLVGSLPWLSGRSPEYTVLRGRYADREATPEALASVRAELGLDDGPLTMVGGWWSGVVRGDLGTSWTSGRPVAPDVVSALSTSLTLMAWSLLVALVVAVAVVAPVLRRGLRGRASLGAGVGAASLTALPEFLLALLLLVVGAVWLRWFPPYGWDGLGSVVLPALALGVPAGGLLGRLSAEACAAVFPEPWVRTWRLAGYRDLEVTGAVLRRALPSVLPQVGLVVVGLTGGAVAVEEVFAVPGLGRTTLGAASSQDLPLLQGGVLALLVLAVVVGVLASTVRRLLLGPGLRAGSLQVPVPVVVRRRRDRVVPLVAGGLLLALVALGLLRDPYAAVHGRLSPPSLALPLGADSSGRDLLARVAHGALTTVGTAVVVTLCCLVVGVLVGLLPRLSVGPVEVANAAPPLVVGLVVAALTGPSLAGAALAVSAVAWAPLAAHTAALVVEARAQPFVRVLPTLGVGRLRTVWRHLLPTVAGPVARHAALRLPATTLALASLGFLGLGPGAPTPEWGLLLAEGTPYVERAPWTVAAPTLALVLVGVVAVSAGALGRGVTRSTGDVRPPRRQVVESGTTVVG